MENKNKRRTRKQKLTGEIHQFLREIDEIAIQHLDKEQSDLRNCICINLKKIHARIDKLNQTK